MSAFPLFFLAQGCTKEASDKAGSVDASMDFGTELRYQAAIGNPGVQGRSDTPGLTRKKLGTSRGAPIRIKEYFVWSIHSDEWERGGSLVIFNDSSLGDEFRVACRLSGSAGDRFKQSDSRREVDIEGKVESYSSSAGLVIDPCTITWDEALDGPRKSQGTASQTEEPRAAAAAAPTPIAIPGVAEGMPYQEARERILSAGWEPVPQTGEGNTWFRTEWPEQVDCAGSGLGQCEFLFTNPTTGKRLRVGTIGEAPRFQRASVEG
jgi:hypothetical protein